MRNLWKQVRYRLEYFGRPRAGRSDPAAARAGRVCALARVLGALYYRLDGTGRAVALENLRLSLGDTLDARRREADRPGVVSELRARRCSTCSGRAT